MSSPFSFRRAARSVSALLLPLAFGVAPGFAASTDPVAVATVGGDSRFAVAAVLLSDRDGTVYSFDGLRALSVSQDLGVTWTAVSLPEELESVSIAPSPGGMLDVAGTDRTGDVLHARSIDAGATWSPTHRVAPGWRGLSPLAATGAGGAIGVVWVAANDTVVSTSTDGGLSFSPVVALGPPQGFSPLLLSWTGERDLLACGWSRGDFVCRASHDRGSTFGLERRFAGRSLLAIPTIVVRGPGDVVLLMPAYDLPSGSAELWTVRSADGGDTWSVPDRALSGIPSGQILLAADTAGETWLQVAGAQPRLYRSSDLSTWRELDPGLSCWLWPSSLVTPIPGTLVFWAQSAGLGAGLGVIGPDMGGVEMVSVFVRSRDGGNTFERLGASGQRHAGNPRLVRTDGGRLIAAWLEGSPAGPLVRASYSDDEGATWSGATAISDRAAATSSTLDLVATGNGAAVVWMGDGGAGCAELRVSRSGDGVGFEPSVAVAAVTSAGRLSLGADGQGRLALLWRDGAAYHTAASSDRGATWSAPAPLGDFLETSWDPSRLVRSEDGALVFVAVVGDALCDWCSTVAYRSEDGGRSWEAALLELRAVAPPITVEMEAGPAHLVAQTPTYECFPECPNERRVYRSEDGGRSWSWRRAESDIAQQHPLAVDSLGNAYYREYQDLVVRASDGREHRVSGALPYELRLISALVRSPGDLALLSDRWIESDEPDVLTFRRLGEGLRRDDSTRSLAVRPDLAAVFPLPEYRFLGAAPGMLDPDAGVVADASRPLVLYGLAEVGGNTLWMVKAGEGRLRLSW